MNVKNIPFLFRAIDKLLTPFMLALGGVHLDAIQETHLWHMQAIACDLLPNNKGTEFSGNDSSKFNNHHLSTLMHAPVLGGWKNYVVLETKGFKHHWYVGWKVLFHDKKKQPICQIQKLKIYEPYIKLLEGPNDAKRIAFGINENGDIIPLKIVDKGILGDGKYKEIRLF